MGVYAEEGPRAPICFVGVGAIVNDDFVHELKTPPHFWLGPELTKRLLRDDSPILSEKQLRDGNSRGGLNLMVWEGCASRGFENNPELYLLRQGRIYSGPSRVSLERSDQPIG